MSKLCFVRRNQEKSSFVKVLKVGKYIYKGLTIISQTIEVPPELIKKENYEISMKMGQPLFSQINEVKPDTLVSGCGTCQIQLTKGTGIDTIHPIVLLNQSYQQGE